MKYKDMTPEQKKKRNEAVKEWNNAHREKSKEYQKKSRLRRTWNIPKEKKENICRYTIYNNYTDNLIVFDATAEEACKAMKIKMSSFRSIVTRSMKGELKKYHITKTRKGMTEYEDIQNMNFKEFAGFLADYSGKSIDVVIEFLNTPICDE